MLGHPKEKSEFRPLIANLPSSSNLQNTNNNDNENSITNKLKRFLQPITTSKHASRLNLHQSRKRATIDLRSRDYKRDASGKKGFQVKIPMKFLTYIAIVFFLVPLMAAFIVLVRIFFFHNGTGHGSHRGIEKFHQLDETMEQNSIVNVAENEQKSSLNSLRGANDGIIDVTGFITDPVEKAGDIFINGTDQHNDQVMKLANDTTPITEQQGVEEGGVASNADVHSPAVNEKLVDKNALSSNIEKVSVESSQLNADFEKTP